MKWISLLLLFGCSAAFCQSPVLTQKHSPGFFIEAESASGFNPDFSGNGFDLNTGIRAGLNISKRLSLYVSKTGMFMNLTSNEQIAGGLLLRTNSFGLRYNTFLSRRVAFYFES